jgi:hypothetical protein
MEDLTYILGLGFSGADVWRAIIIAFFVAMIAGKKRSVWFMGLVALLADRIVWPIVGMALSGSDIQSIYASIGAITQTFVDDLGLYAVRYLGLTIMIAGFVASRSKIHTIAPAGKKAKPAAA